MIQYKTLTLLRNIKIKFIGYTKKKNHTAKYLKFQTKRIIVNRAPKHFNIGQHSIKIRLYSGMININANYLTTSPIYFFFAAKKTFSIVQLQIHEIPKKIVFYYHSKFKFNINVIYN